MQRDALFAGPRRRYRPRLTRAWHGGDGVCTFIGLNPSTADASIDDPTIRRCMGFARNWGFTELSMVNLFDYRATDPVRLKRARCPCSGSNDAIILAECSRAGRVVYAWGNHGVHRDRCYQVAEFLSQSGIQAWTFGLTKAMQPLHPLYQRRDARLSRFLGGECCGASNSR